MVGYFELKAKGATIINRPRMTNDKKWYRIGLEHLPIAFNLDPNIKTEAEQPPNQIKQPTGDPEHQPLKMRKMRKNVKSMIDPKFI